jgi:hypothetical protein
LLKAVPGELVGGLGLNGCDREISGVAEEEVMGEEEPPLLLLSGAR